MSSSGGTAVASDTTNNTTTSSNKQTNTNATTNSEFTFLEQPIVRRDVSSVWSMLSFQLRPFSHYYNDNSNNDNTSTSNNNKFILSYMRAQDSEYIIYNLFSHIIQCIVALESVSVQLFN